MKKLRIVTVLAALAVLFSADIANAQKADSPSRAGAEYFVGMIIYANDVDRSVKFYSDVMGLKIVGRVEKEGRLIEILLSKSGKLFDGAVVAVQPTNGYPARSDPNRLKFGVILFMTDSNKVMADRLRAAGYEVTERDPLHILTKDPDGHQIMIYQFDEQLRKSHQ